MLHVTAFALLALLLIWWPRLRRKELARVGGALMCLMVALVIRWRCFAPPRICVLDVGQGDAILVQDGSHAILVDAGPADELAAALARNHVLGLDAVVVTHLHDDHYAGMATQEINWPINRDAMYDYLQNSFLVADDEEDD